VINNLTILRFNERETIWKSYDDDINEDIEEEEF